VLTTSPAPQRRDALLVDPVNRQVHVDAPPGPAAGVSVRTVDTHVRRLRVKLGRYQVVLTSVRGHGYRFEARPDVRVVSARVIRPERPA
jgi:hypothetical protein